MANDWQKLWQNTRPFYWVVSSEEIFRKLGRESIIRDIARIEKPKVSCKGWKAFLAVKSRWFFSSGGCSYPFRKRELEYAFPRTRLFVWSLVLEKESRIQEIHLPYLWTRAVLSSIHYCPFKTVGLFSVGRRKKWHFCELQFSKHGKIQGGKNRIIGCYCEVK